MVVAFCGHGDFLRSEEYERKLFDFLREKVGDGAAEFYLGGYGGFDCFAYDCCKAYQKTNPKVSLVLVTPYIHLEYQRNYLREQAKKYDDILYPEIEDKPKRYAIVYRNRYMMERADYVVAYITRTWGGAYTTYQYAKRKGKEIFDLANFEE